MLSDFGATQQIIGASANDLSAIIEIEIQPTGNITESGVAIAIFIEKVVSLNGEANVVDAISNGIDQVGTQGLHSAAISLDLVKAGFDSAFIIAMQDKKVVVAVGLDPLAELAQITAADPTIEIHTCSVYRLEDQPIEPIGRIEATPDLSS